MLKGVSLQIVMLSRFPRDQTAVDSTAAGSMVTDTLWKTVHLGSIEVCADMFLNSTSDTKAMHEFELTEVPVTV